MPAKIIIRGMYKKCPSGFVVNTTSHGAGWERDLSPFYIGPCEIKIALNVTWPCKRMENAWQFTKVYKHHLNEYGLPSSEWVSWLQKGIRDDKPHRYPMGKGAKPEYSWWEEERLDYIEARKKIYVPLYAEAVQRFKGWQTLKDIYMREETLVLRDFDGYDYSKTTLSEVLNNPNKKMGHAFVLAMLLTEDKALEECDL